MMRRNRVKKTNAKLTLSYSMLIMFDIRLTCHYSMLSLFNIVGGLLFLRTVILVNKQLGLVLFLPSLLRYFILMALVNLKGTLLAMLEKLLVYGAAQLSRVLFLQWLLFLCWHLFESIMVMMKISR